jgi:outer membrane protein assembly factor BamD
VVEPEATTEASHSGTGLGVEVVTPGSDATPTGTGASNLPAATGAQDPNYGLPMPKATSTALPPVEKPAEAPDQLNEAEGHATNAAAPDTTTTANGKKKKVKAPKEDKTDESSSKHKPKKGLDKLNPF